MFQIIKHILLLKFIYSIKEKLNKYKMLFFFKLYFYLLRENKLSVPMWKYTAHYVTTMTVNRRLMILTVVQYQKQELHS